MRTPSLWWPGKVSRTDGSVEKEVQPSEDNVMPLVSGRGGGEHRFALLVIASSTGSVYTARGGAGVGTGRT